MFALVQFSRVLPYLYPEVFPKEKAVVAEPSLREEEGMQGAPPAADPSTSKRLKSLYQRNLRKQRNEALTYSGVLQTA
jgi:hypothetical protein